MNEITLDLIKTKQEEVRKFLLGLVDLRPGIGVRACGMNIGKNNVSTVRNGGCHASFRSVPNPIAIGGGFFPQAGQMEIAQKFWDFVTDKKRSPWKVLMQNGIELVIHPDDKLPVGWILPYETVKNTPFLFQKNFAILTRVFTEKHKQFIIWDKLLKKGVDPADALYLCGLLFPVANTEGFSYNNSNLSGAHWPLTDYYYAHKNADGTVDKAFAVTNKKIDFKALRSGDIIDNDSLSVSKGYGIGTVRDNINGYFQELVPSEREVFDVTNYCEMKKSGGSFSQVAYYDIDDVVDGFYRWQDQEGILNVRE